MTELINSGVELMFVGMGIVFLFLTMLVVVINIMSSMVLRFFPEAPPMIPVVTTTSGTDKSVIAAITAAVHQHRTKHKQD